MDTIPNTAKGYTSATLFVAGMDCDDEVVLVEQALKRLPGVQQWQANLMSQEVSVEFDAAAISLEQIIRTFSATASHVAKTSIRGTAFMATSIQVIWQLFK